jgi:LysR family transcriptional regulator, regulator for bpeEF and oprC
MKNLTQLMNFSAVGRHGSFSRAARELGLTPSSLTKSVARLEHELGTRLLYRTTRSVTLTEEGHALYLKSLRLLEEIEALDLTATRDGDEPAGVLRVGAPVSYGVHVLLPVLKRLRERYPRVEIDLRLSDARVSVQEEGLDAAIRFGILEDSSLIAKKIDEQPMILCASPDYLVSHPRIRTVSDLDHHTLIAFRMPTDGRDRPFRFSDGGHQIELRPDAPIRIDHGEGLVHAAKLGAGLTQVPKFLLRSAIADGALVEVLSDHRPTPLAVSVILPGSRIRPPRVRALLDALANVGGGAD